MLKRAMAEEVRRALQSVITRVNEAHAKTGKAVKPRLVAVSKTKPKELIFACYDEGQRHFGENYIQELVDKATDEELRQKCPDIKWHFIGHAQRNKVNKLLSVPGLYLIETVDSSKLADSLNSSWGKINPTEPARIFVQVNTSGEEAKSGCSPDAAGNLVQHILTNCKNLKFSGLMTIGQYGYDTSLGPNPDFKCLSVCKEKVCKELNLKEDDVEVSMGMSDDFEQAIEMGSTNVRVGSTIFGVRVKKDETEKLSEAMSDVKVG